MKKNLQKRHKCHLCGAVRYESRMRKPDQEDHKRPGWSWASSQYGNDQKLWVCKHECWRR